MLLFLPRTTLSGSGKTEAVGRTGPIKEAAAGIKWTAQWKEGREGDEDIIKNIDLLEKSVRDEVKEVAEHIKVIAQDMSRVRTLDLKVISSAFEWMQKMQDTLLKDYEKETAKYYQDIALTLKMSVSGNDFILKMRILDTRVRDIRARSRKELSAEEREAIDIYDKHIAHKRDAYIKELNSTVKHFVASVKAVIGKAKKAAYREIGGKAESFVTVGEEMLDK
ncbi:MAG: hypothetical protein HQL30_11480 [Candidatus Omnitrophica bacterium]|nr:hypothetical protein [Candidatus Omnitrophota bacterium]